MSHGDISSLMLDLDQFRWFWHNKIPINVKKTSSNWWSVGSLVDCFLLLNNGGMFCRNVHAKWAKKSLQVSMPIAACRRLRSSNKTNKTKKHNETLWGCQKHSWMVLVVSNSQGYDFSVLPIHPGLSGIDGRSWTDAIVWRTCFINWLGVSFT